MQIIVRGTNVAVTPGLRQHVEKKANKLSPLLHDSAKIEVVQHVQRELQIAEVILQTDRLVLRAMERTTDMYASIEAAIDKIERQLKRLKEKKKATIHKDVGETRQSSKTVAAETEEEAPEELEPLPHRRLLAKPMTEDEAMMQINASGEELLVFQNVITQQTNVLHRLSDGSLELVEPETG